MIKVLAFAGDIKLSLDGAKLNFGSDSEVTLTHVQYWFIIR